jgi:selenium metabolism protein YedF
MENVSRFLKTLGYSIAVNHEGGEYLVIGNRNEGIASEGEKEQTVEGEEQKVMVMVSSDQMGRGDDELGCKLMISFLKTLKEMGSDLWRLVFLNNGVKLTIGGSEALQDLKDLENQGIHILVCGTCLSHFNLLEKKDVGQTTNMLDIVTAMQLADKVVNV